MSRVAIVTGASSGIGLETARGLVAQGYHVVLAVRDTVKGDAAAREIGGGEVMRLDVSDLESVHGFARTFLGLHDRLDLLVNNAGIHTAEDKRSPQGHEWTLATNHLGHFLLTDLLLNMLEGSAPSRVVNVASEAHRGARGVSAADAPGGRAAPMGGIRAYTESKLANIMFTYALARRLEGTGVSVFAVHPGSVRSGWARGGDSGMLRWLVLLTSPFMLSVRQGARTTLYAATSPDLDGMTGLYLARSRIATSSAASRDVEAQERLWRFSEEAVGLREASVP